MDAPSTQPAPEIPKRANLKWLVRLALGLALVALLVGRDKGVGVAQVLGSVSWLVLPGSVLFYWAGQVLSAAKWQMLLRARGAALSLRECCRLYLIGMFCNLWMPTNIGGDAVRAYLAAPRCGGKAVAAASVLVERLTGLAALLLIGLGGLLGVRAGGGDANTNGMSANGTNAAYLERVAGLHEEPMLHLLATMIGALLLLALGVWCLRAPAVRLEQRAPQHRLARAWAGLHQALDFYLRPETRGALAVALGLSLLFQASQVVLNIALARAVGLALPGAVFWWLVPALTLASLLPVGLGGLGVREAAAVTLLSNSGLLNTSAATGHSATAATVVAWSLLWQATIWLSSLPGIFWRGRGEELSAELAPERVEG